MGKLCRYLGITNWPAGVPEPAPTEYPIRAAAAFAALQAVAPPGWQPNKIQPPLYWRCEATAAGAGAVSVRGARRYDTAVRRAAAEFARRGHYGSFTVRAVAPARCATVEERLRSALQGPGGPALPDAAWETLRGHLPSRGPLGALLAWRTVSGVLPGWLPPQLAPGLAWCAVTPGGRRRALGERDRDAAVAEIRARETLSVCKRRPNK